MPAHYKKDLPQMAFASLLCTDGKHRNPQLCDVESTDSFFKYLLGVINSKLYSLRQQEKDQLYCEELTEEIQDGIPTPDRQAEWADDKMQLFAQLKAQMAPRHQPTIQGWEQEFEHSDRIPVIGSHRKYVGEIREKAQIVAIELDMF